MSSANRDILTVSLPICIPFIPSCCLIALARNSSTVLNGVEIMGIVLDLEDGKIWEEEIMETGKRRKFWGCSIR
jgi:hypothetical protein